MITFLDWFEDLDKAAFSGYDIFENIKLKESFKVTWETLE